jgi:hypothetical protein
MFCYLFSGFTVFGLLFTIIFLWFGFYIHPVFMIFSLLFLPFLVSSLKLARPYFLAKIIENELKELDKGQ